MSSNSEADDVATKFRHAARYGEAAYLYLTRIYTDGGTADTWHGLGVCLALARHDAAAIDAFRRAVALDPGHAGARYNLGVLLRDRDPAAAARHLSVLRRQRSDLAELLAGQLEVRG